MMSRLLCFIPTVSTASKLLQGLCLQISEMIVAVPDAIEQFYGIEKNVLNPTDIFIKKIYSGPILISVLLTTLLYVYADAVCVHH